MMEEEALVIDVTIIIPFFNDSKRIINLVKSCYKVDEIIIVDDKSDEIEFSKLENIARSFPNVSIKKNETNEKGAGICRNIGLSNAKNSWLLFADSDDVFLPGFYSEIGKYIDSDFDMVFFPPLSSDETGNLGHRHDTYVSYFKSENELRYLLPVVWSRMFRKEFLNSNNILFEESLVSNDRRFSLESGIYADKIFASEESIYCWQFNSNSLTTKMSKSRFLVNLGVNERCNIILKRNLSKKMYNQYSESGSKYLAMSLFRYKFGCFFTCKVALNLIRGHMPLFKPKDLLKIKNFKNNNKLYTK